MFEIHGVKLVFYGIMNILFVDLIDYFLIPT